MGNCAGSGRGSPAKEKRKGGSYASSKDADNTPGELVLKILVEVNRLSSEDGALRWQPILDGLVPLTVHNIQETDTTGRFRLEATGVDGISFGANLKCPGTKLRKSSTNFVQWKDDENGEAWGLNFMSESDADSFLKSCFPPSLSPESDMLHYNLSSVSLSVPIPAPPIMADTTAAQDPDITREDKHNTEGGIPSTPVDDTQMDDPHHDPHHEHEEPPETAAEDELLAPSFLSPSPSEELFCEESFSSVHSEGYTSSGSESLELYQPSSPFKIREEFILPDIKEESERDSEEDSEDRSDLPSLHSSLADGELDIKETSFSNEHFFNDASPENEELAILPDLAPPILPISPPPGPLLSPELEVAPEVTTLNQQSLPDKYNPKSFRHSVAGVLEDMPPPLPMTQPPGRLISPRHSSGFLDLAELSTSDRKHTNRQLDMSQLVLKMNKMADHDVTKCEPQAVETNKVSEVAECEPQDTNIDTQSVISDDVLTLVPPVQDHPDGDFDDEEDHDGPSLTRQRLGSYHLKTFEPPKEFSDSGFQDTDVAATENARIGSVATSKPTFASDGEERSASILITKTDSDEQLTENSGSIGIKTIASSGSENSALNETCEDGEMESAVSNTIEVEGTKVVTPTMAELIEPSTVLMSIIRKTGWLEMKTVLVCKNRKVAPKSKRKWKKYWANLKRSTLLLYECDERSTLPELETMHSDLKLDLESSIAHAVHDYVKRDNLFCLSTSSGNTYYMQTSSQAEVEDWITCVHCAAAVASTLKDRDNSVPILLGKIGMLNKKIEKENQLRNLTSLNLSAASDDTAKAMAVEKLVECSENVEAYNVELYRIRCYIASLQGTELPNPHSLLGSISKPTKGLLGRIGIFSVASLHAIVSARHSIHSSVNTTSLHVPKPKQPKQPKLRDKFASLPRSPAGLKKRKGSLDIGPILAWGKSTKAKSSSLPAGIKGSVSLRSLEISGPFPKLSPGKSMNMPRGRKMSLDMVTSYSDQNLTSQSSPDGTPRSRRAVEISGPYPVSPKSPAGLAVKARTPHHSDLDERTGDETEDNMQDVFPAWPFSLVNVVNVRIPSGKHGGETVRLTLRNDMTVEQLLVTVCEQFKLNFSDHFVRLKSVTEVECIGSIPESTDVVMEQHYTEIEICQKSLQTFSLATEEGYSFGLVLVPEWDAKTEIDLRSVIVEDVKKGGVAESKGIRKGDEVALIEGKSVMELGWVEVERLMSGREVNLTVRTCLVDAPLSHHSTARIVESLICPAPPTTHPEISGEMLRSLVVPTPIGSSSGAGQEEDSDISNLSKDQIELLLRDTNDISRLLRKWQSQQMGEVAKVPWTKDDKLKKSIGDLIDSEGDYVRLLNVLVERYFEPLRHETYLNQHEVSSIIGNITDLVKVQNCFLADLKGTWIVEAEDLGESLKQVVLKVAGLFLKHVGHFKSYSAFCASHQLVKQLLALGDNEELIKFFKVRNPTLDPSLNVDSLLTKPIVRISRYPLFLSAMVDHMTKGSEECLHLKDVIKQMGVVADHMNEMQRLCEMYWPLIHNLSNDPKLHEIGVSVRIPELEYHRDLTWLNPAIDGLSKNWKKGQGPRMTMFIFKSSVVLICLEKKHKRKENKGTHEIRVEVEDAKYRHILPTVRCAVSNLPDSDGVTNMWRLQHRTKAHTTVYFFRSNSSEDKMLATDLIHRSVLEQQQLYGASPSILRATSPTVLQGSPYQQHRNRKMTSPTPSNLSTSTLGYGTASDTDHDC